VPVAYTLIDDIRLKVRKVFGMEKEVIFPHKPH